MEFHNFFQIDNKTFIKVNHDSQGVKEFYHNARSWVKDAKKLPFCDLIAFFLATPDGNYYEEFVDFEALGDEVIMIPQEYYHNSIIPPIETYKEIIEEYCSIIDPRKLKPFKDRINRLEGNITILVNKNNQLNNLISKTLVIDNNTAKDRIHNHLSYKLGHAMIENSKSFLGYIRMPYVLSYITEQHNKEQKQYHEKIKKNPKAKLPQLESYPDYKEALKEKECFTYKLGEALIKANNTSFIGGGGLYQAII
ncbi:sugar transferase [Helicobacter winghamensis]